MLSLLWALLVTVLVLALAYWFTKHVVGRMAGGALLPGRRMTVLEQISLGKEQRLLLVKVGEQIYFLSVTPGGTTILREFSKEEADSWMVQAEPVLPPQEGFAQILQRMREKRSK